jgi:formylglycine-generating enzyme required for sulfatase activity
MTVRFAFLGVALAFPVLAQSPDFAAQVAPLLQKNCLSCHSSGKVNLTSRQAMIDSKILNPGKPDRSSLYTTVANGTMPPSGRLPEAEVKLLRTWIEYGAQWAEAGALAPPPVATNKNLKPADVEMANVAKIRERILAGQDGHAIDKPYKVTVPNTIVSYDVVPVPAGDFTMGSPASVTGAAPDEKPSHKVHVDAFAMQAHEVTWDEYRLFMFANQAGETTHKDEVVDAVSRPTRPYVEMSFGMGINGYPAISMTQNAANKYAEWLSSKTGEFYRLPTEAEWEYACRAGTETAYFFGNDASMLGDYAWFAGNAGGKYARVATRKPNPWGLYDMLGNVMEWTLDAYAPYQGKAETDPWVRATKPYPQAVRGGSWNDPAGKVRCAARVASDASWKQQDPQLPKSIWYMTDAQWLGFRLVRPGKVPSAEEMFRYWNNGVEHDEQ